MAERVIEGLLPGLGEEATSASPDHVHLGHGAPAVRVVESGEQR